MPNQNECDHRIAVNTINGGLVYASDNPLCLSITFRDKYRLVFYRFAYCPDCGAPIDWQKIKEACDAESK